jgi:hypothetical protein
MPNSVGKPGGLSTMLVGIPGWGGSGDFLRLFLFLKKQSIVSLGKRGNLGWTHNAKSPMWEFVPLPNRHEYNWSSRRERDVSHGKRSIHWGRGYLDLSGNMLSTLQALRHFAQHLPSRNILFTSGM